MSDSVTAPATAPAAAPATPAPTSEPTAAPATGGTAANLSDGAERAGASLLGGGAPPASPASQPIAPAPTDQPAAREDASSNQDGGEAPPADGEPPKDGDKPAGPTPEDYGDFTFPEGFQVDEAALGEFKGLSAKLGLTKEQAQQLIDFRAAQHQQYMAALDHQAEQWVQDARSDTEFGGTEFGRNVAIADRAIATYGTPELRALLNQYGLGNHPELVRFAYRVGLTVTEPGPVNTRSPAPEAMSTAEYYAKEVFNRS